MKHRTIVVLALALVGAESQALAQVPGTGQNHPGRQVAPTTPALPVPPPKPTAATPVDPARSGQAGLARPARDKPGSFKAAGAAELFAGNGTGSALSQGGLVKLDPTTFAGVLVADSIATYGITGLAVTPDGRLWGSAGVFSASNLVELDPSTGALISQVPITLSGAPVRIADLAVQPGTGALYGVGGSLLGSIFKINTTTGAATLVGSVGMGYDGGLAFDDAGTLYMISAAVVNPNLVAVNPATGAAIWTLGYGPDVGLDGLTVRPSDGALLATRGGFTGGDLIVEVNPLNGLTTQLGTTGTGNASDLAFRMAPVTGGDLLAANAAGSPASPGGLAKLDTTSFAGALIADAVTPGGLSGLAATPDGRLFGSVVFNAGISGGANLVELNPSTGGLISQVAIATSSGVPVRIGDLAVQPGTGALYGSGGRISGGSPLGEIFTINTTTGVATLVGFTGFANDGGLAFNAAGTLFATLFSGQLLTINPATGGSLTSIAYGPASNLDGLVVRPSDGALLATRGGVGGGDQIVLIDPATGNTTLLGSAGSGQASDLAFFGCPPTASSTVVRLGTPPNPNAYKPGTQGPILSTVWDPRIDHTTFLPTAVLDFAAFSGTASNIPLPFGVLLCALPHFGAQLVGPGVPFAFPIPAQCSLAGVSLCTQGGAITANGTIQITNALDLVIGTF
jgi:hypothetical protein